MKLINGIQISECILEKLKLKIESNKLNPRLDIIWVGDDFASEIYVNKKKAQGEKVGIQVEVHHYPQITENRLIEVIQTLNEQELVDGIMIQLPIKGDIDQQKVLQYIDIKKDVDGLNPISLGYLWQGEKKGFISATPLAVMECIKHAVMYSDGKYTGEEADASFVEKELKDFLKGKEITIINHSNIVGKPLAAILLNYNATLNICHKFTKDLKRHTLNSDIIISGTGVSGLINKEHFSKGTMIIDIGINETANGVGGDVDYRGAEDKIGWLTPVPGGVGPLTVAMLLSNVVKSAERKFLEN